MGKYEVTCINKRGSHHDPHERIEFIGKQNNWRMAEDKAIARIEGGQDSFFVQKGGKEVKVVVATHKGRKYLKTEADGYEPNNLLSLPECTGCKDI